MQNEGFEALSTEEQEPFRNAAYGGTLTPAQMWHRVMIDHDPVITSTLFKHMEAQGRQFREAQRTVKAERTALRVTTDGGIGKLAEKHGIDLVVVPPQDE